MRLLTSALLGAAGFSHAFPERGLVDADLCAALGVPSIVQVKQIHGARVVEASQAAGAEADAIVARPRMSPRSPERSPRTAAGVRVADCVPILLGDEASGAVAAIHAGWRGVVAGVVRAGALFLAGDPEGDASPERLVRPSAVVAAIGPCIGACCFEVGADVADAIERACASGAVVARRDGSKAFVDLRAAVRAQLVALGIDPSRVDDVGGCTKHEADRFHSFRRDGQNSGRMLAAIATRSYA